ncbi:transposase [Flavobacterium sp. NPDC079362]|uniref:transposase n=1 Tax=Flavobacterium sp. NPDC079362 TaxID=3390566 RepID=UPI003D03D8FD
MFHNITFNYQSILDYFDNRITNDSAESFNAKIKAFRCKLREVRNVDFCLIRLNTLFA